MLNYSLMLFLGLLGLFLNLIKLIPKLFNNELHLLILLGESYMILMRIDSF